MDERDGVIAVPGSEFRPDGSLDPLRLDERSSIIAAIIELLIAVLRCRPVYAPLRKC